MPKISELTAITEITDNDMVNEDNGYINVLVLG